MIPAVPPFFSTSRSCYRALHVELFVHSRYRSRPARPTHAFALQSRRSGASSAIPATDFHQPSALYAAIPAYYSPSPRFNCRVSYHRPPTVSTKSAGSRVPTLHNRSLRATARSANHPSTPRPLRATPRPLRATPRPLRATPRPLRASHRPLRATPRPLRATPRPLRATPRPLRATPLRATPRSVIASAAWQFRRRRNPRSIQRDRHVVALLAMTKRVRVRKCGLRRATAFGN